jgi:hypothetical protein
MRSGKSSDQFAGLGEGGPYHGPPVAPGSTPRWAGNWFLTVRVLILVISLTGAIIGLIRHVTDTARPSGGAIQRASNSPLPGETSFSRPPSTPAVSAALATIVKRFPNAQFGTFGVDPLDVQATIVTPGGDVRDVTVPYGGTPRIQQMQWPWATFARRLIDPQTVQTVFIALRRQFGIKPTAVNSLALFSWRKPTPLWVASVTIPGKFATVTSSGQPTTFSAKLDGTGLKRGSPTLSGGIHSSPTSG